MPRRPSVRGSLPVLSCLAAALVVGTTSTRAPDAPTFLVLPYLQLPTPTTMTVMWETSARLPGTVEYGPTADLGSTAKSPRATVLHEVTLKGLKPATTYHYRVRSGALVSETYTFRTAPAPGTRRWRMALYGDSRSYPETHRKVAEAIRKANVDLIVHTGDIVTNGKDHDSWRKQFFEPLGPLARSVPWVSTIGNHERDSDNYFSYMALPGNERYFGFDYANAHIVCLDSNSWIEKTRDSEQGKWLVEHLAARRDATWTFVVFHHPLFSAHATRPIAALRWDWAPIFLDPANHVDAVLTGHDHFYARNWRMGRLSAKPSPGVLFLTSAGGGASLYRTKQRDYVAKEKSVHHFTLFEFDGDRVTISAHDVSGNEFDRYAMTKEPTPPEEFCAYEVEELRRHLRAALNRADPVRLPAKGTGTIDTELRVATKFAVPIEGRLEYGKADGWKLKRSRLDFALKPGEPLRIPLQAEVAAGAFRKSPTVTIVFEVGRFRNRRVELSPFQLAGPESVTVTVIDRAMSIDGKLDEKVWAGAPEYQLLGLPPQGGRADRVRLLADREHVYLGAVLDDPTGKVEVRAGNGDDEGGRLILREESVSLVLSDGKRTHLFALTPAHQRYHDGPDDEERIAWRAAAAARKGGWSVEMAVPRSLFADWSKVRANVLHHRGEGKESDELQLCPTYTSWTDPDVLPSVRAIDSTERYATVVLK